MPDNSSNAQEMRSLPTGGKGGGGAVFALEIVHETIIAGTRKGQVKIFDARDSAKASSVQSIKLTSSVTNVRTVPGTESYVVVAAMDGSLATYDLRLLKRDAPVQSYRGHDNSYMRDLGFDVTKDHVLAGTVSHPVTAIGCCPLMSRKQLISTDGSGVGRPRAVGWCACFKENKRVPSKH